MRQLVLSRRSDLRVRRAKDFLSSRAPSEELLVLAQTFEVAAELSRSAVPAFFGWRRSTLARHALELARPALLAKGLTAASALSLEALWARVTYELGESALLHRLSPLEGKPGLARALARTVGELRALGVAPTSLEPALRDAMVAFERALAEAKLADRAQVFELAREAVAEGAAPLLLFDVTVSPGVEQRFVEQLVASSGAVLAVAPADDERTLEALAPSFPPAEVLEPAGPSAALTELQRNLFTAASPATAQRLDFFSAPGEAREAVEIARRVLELARAGVPFDEMAVLLRSPGAYRAPLEDAFRRAHLKAHFATGLPRPDPAGRALLSLLRCAEEGLSARRFSEYLSLSQVPKLEAAGTPPAAQRPFVRPDSTETVLPPSVLPTPAPAPAEEVTDVDAPAVLGQLRAPRRWEHLLVEAAVIGGTDRWRRRLSGLRARYEAQLQAPGATEGQVNGVTRSLGDLSALEAFALPLLDELAALPSSAPWGVWLEALVGLATRALREPGRVVALLHELAPMAPVGPVELSEVRVVLTRRLSEVTEAPSERRAGGVFVGPVESARGRSFHTVFVPGLAERVFPQKLREDPLLPDRARAALDGRLEVNTPHRIAAERLALLVAVGAARENAVLSYPRIDAEHGRPRVPSFYALEAARAVQGELPSFEALQRQAESSANVRLAWPAPQRRELAIDDTEYDLATIDGIFRAKAPVKGRARYLVATNAHLARALRARFARWELRALSRHDGLVLPGAVARPALDANQFGTRPFSPTALEQYALCPYRFYLSALVRLQPLETPGELEELGPLEKGSMAHEVQFKLLSRLRDEGVRVTPERLGEVLERLEAVVEEVAADVYDEFKPAIERVWEDGVATLKSDLREWLSRTAKDAEWQPAHFELAFGLTSKPKEEQDPRSVPAPVKVMEGLSVRGSIDLVERHVSGTLRATDYKTGKVKADAEAIIGGGRHLQPILYSLVLEQLFPGVKIWGGRLYYTTFVGGFTERPVLLDSLARESFGLVVRTIRESLATGFFPAMPGEGACAWCDYRAVCGPEEERRVVQSRKNLKAELVPLRTLRDKP